MVRINFHGPSSVELNIGLKFYRVSKSPFYGPFKVPWTIGQTIEPIDQNPSKSEVKFHEIGLQPVIFSMTRTTFHRPKVKNFILSLGPVLRPLRTNYRTLYGPFWWFVGKLQRYKIKGHFYDSLPRTVEPFTIRKQDL
uniref:Uncharacterized protein n=1 Tax=Solanum tuberosum TaxID=4113 RepID=M1D9W6_SOLTU